MNNYTLYFAESKTRAAASYQKGIEKKNKTSSKGVDVLAQHEYRHRKYCEAVCHMSGVQAHATTRKSITL